MIEEVNAFIYGWFWGKKKSFIRLCILFPTEQNIANFYMYAVFFNYDATPKKTQYHYNSMAQVMSNCNC